MTARKLMGKSWFYDFSLEGHPRQRKAGFRTKAAAQAAEKEKKEDLLQGRRRLLFANVFQLYIESRSMMKDRAKDSFGYLWKRIEPEIGHLFVEQVQTVVMDQFKAKLPLGLSAKTINQHLILIRAILRFAWKRALIANVPYVPMEEMPVGREAQWYTEAERDRLLAAMYVLRPRWYLFYYLTVRLGLRKGEVYAVAGSRIREVPAQLVVDRAVQRGTVDRPAKLVTRKNGTPVILDLPADVVEAIRWHVGQGYAGPEFLFSASGEFPRYLDNHLGPLRAAQKAAGLRELGHHAVGRHSVASPAVTGGGSIKAVQAQLGHRSAASTHRYAHLGCGAQLQLVEGLRPVCPPHQRGAVGTG